MLQHKVPIWMFYAFIAYFSVFMIAVGAVFIWQINRRKERPPEKFKLLRGPGETLRRRVLRLDENLFWYFVAGALVPLVLAWSVLIVAIRLPKNLILIGAVLALLVLVVALIVAATVLLRLMRRRRNDFLGYLGERAVAESLDTLREKGYRVFHDVPANGRETDFNLDHVVVGRTGVSIVETKARRKRKRCKEGRQEYEVIFDGKRLIWPWGEDRSGCNQVLAQADWLGKWLERRIALHVDPKPILALPGWFVIERKIDAFRVANHKMLPSLITQWRPQNLTPEQVDLISRQLDEHCRDVED
jgi:Nuclease-related domain